MLIRAAVTAAFGASISIALAQAPAAPAAAPQGPLPIRSSAMSDPNLMQKMQGFALSLGVTCNHCHSAARGSGLAEPKKDIARVMMAMTADLNEKIRMAAGPEATRVECITCHRGVPIPKQIGDIVSQSIKEKGVQEAMTQYRDLRAKYFSKAAYDFSDEPLFVLGQTLSSVRPDDALEVLKTNLEFNPKSARSYTAMANAYTRKLDDASAIDALEAAAELEPENGMIRGRLEQLKSYRRKR
jgi:tetratricopeptide (TPR) repeat protein